MCYIAIMSLHNSSARIHNPVIPWPPSIPAPRTPRPAECPTNRALYVKASNSPPVSPILATLVADCRYFDDICRQMSPDVVILFVLSRRIAQTSCHDKKIFSRLKQGLLTTLDDMRYPFDTLSINPVPFLSHLLSTQPQAASVRLASSRAAHSPFLERGGCNPSGEKHQVGHADGGSARDGRAAMTPARPNLQGTW